MEVPPVASRLEVAYAGLDLLAPERLRFRHRLAGFERELRDAGNRRASFYTNVPPGRYRFEMSARVARGQERNRQVRDGTWKHDPGLRA